MKAIHKSTAWVAIFVVALLFAAADASAAVHVVAEKPAAVAVA